MGVGAPLGNKNAVKENRLWSDTIRRALAQKNGAKLRALVDRLIDRAAEGDIAALKEIGDRIDGKAAQALLMQGDPDKPLEQRIQVEIVDPKG